jgi:hypothetical protein
MATDPDAVTSISPVRPALPDTVEIDLSAGMPRHSPRETRILEQHFGKPFDVLLGEEGASQADREIIMGWLTLRRLGYDPALEDMEDVLIDFVNAPNPPEGGSSVSSPPSAAGTG